MQTHSILLGLLCAAIGASVMLFWANVRYRRMLAAANLHLHETELALDLAEMVGKVGTWKLDRATSTSTWSDEVFRIHDRPVHLGPPSLDQAIACYHEDDRAMVMHNVSNAFETGDDFEFEARLLLPGGETRNVISRGTCHFDIDGNITGLFGVFVELHR